MNFRLTLVRLFLLLRYKVGVPILFNDSADKFFSQNKEQLLIIHNNMKARIVDFVILDKGDPTECIQFDIEIDRPLIDLNVDDFEIIGNTENGNSIIRFAVNKNKSMDEDDDGVSKAIVPFQIVYAVSIHKAQELEYDSVKIIITDEIDELITHSIFYTAITRARKKLKIYWTQAVDLSNLREIFENMNRNDEDYIKLKDYLEKYDKAITYSGYILITYERFLNLNKKFRNS